MYRILFIAPTPPRYTGPEIATKHLLESSLVKRFSIIHVRSNVRTNSRDQGRIDFVAVLRFLRISWEILWKAFTLRPHLVYCVIGSNKSGFVRDVCVVSLAKLTCRKVVTHYRGGNFDNFYKFSSVTLKRIIRFGLRQMDIIIVEGHRLKNMLDGLYPRDRVRVVYNGINLADVKKELKLHRDRKRFNILFMGNVSFAKGFYDLILAYKKVLEKHPEVHLNFTGEIIRLEDERNIIPKYFSGEIKERFLNSTDAILNFVNNAGSYNANHLGFIEEEGKRRVFEDADIFVLPSYSEGFSCAVLEALAFGLPIVTTNVGALPEIVTDGENGFVIEPGDYEALSEKIIRLVEDQNLRRDMALRNIEKAAREFNIERVAKDLGDIFVEVASLRDNSTGE